MQVINKKIIVIFICLFIFSFGLFKLLDKQEIELDDVKLDIRDTNNTFAIYLENGYESNNYEESSNNEFPSVGYSFNKEKSQCLSIDGSVIDNVLSYDNETNKVVVDTTDSINCYLYFDRLTLGDAIKVLKPHGLNLGITSSSADWTGMYRFQGQQKDNIENYICFGTEENCNASNETRDKYMYRIIGIEESGRVKLIKKEALDKTEQWWSYNETSKYWNESLVFQHINDTTFLKNTELVPPEWIDKIDDNNWLFGSIYSDLFSNGANQIGVEVYKIESGQKEVQWYEKANSLNEEYKGVKAQAYATTNGDHPGTEYYYIKHNEIWTETENPHEKKAKIGLMNISDYYLSVSNTANCQQYGNTYEICRTGWMNLSQNDDTISSSAEWTMTRFGWDIYSGVFRAHVAQNGATGFWHMSSPLLVRPVFFLKNNLKLIDGKGTIDEPFIIQ